MSDDSPFKFPPVLGRIEIPPRQHGKSVAGYVAQIEALQDENKRLREALEKLADESYVCPPKHDEPCFAAFARAALVAAPPYPPTAPGMPVCPAWCGDVADPKNQHGNQYLTALPSDNRLHAFGTKDCMLAGRHIAPSPPPAKPACARCGGSGTVACGSMGGIYGVNDKECPACHGAGHPSQGNKEKP